MPAKLDLSGQKFGRLLCIDSFSEIRPNGNKRVRWNCICECGAGLAVFTGDLRGGHTKSCGCLLEDSRVENATTHGMKGTKEYAAWQSCKSRCFNPNYVSYEDYGGRGIKVCEDWEDSFQNFYKDMGDKPTPKHTLERLDVNGDYCKENCVWATYTEQSLNRRTRKDSKSGRTGVCWNAQARKWQSHISVEGKLIRLVYTDCLELAIFCREEAEMHYFGKVFNT